MLPRSLRRVLSGGLAVSVSQVLNTATNILLTIVCARAVDTASYGAWAVVYAGFVLVLQSSRSVVSTVVLVHRDVTDTVPTGLRTTSSSAALWGAVPVGLCLLAPSLLLVAEQARGSAVVVIALLPLLLLQDHLRQLAFRDGAPMRAVWLDLAWLGLQVVLTVALVESGRDDLTTLTLAWAAGAALPALVVALVRRYRGAWDVRHAVAFWKANGSASGKLLAESLLGTGVLQLLPPLLALAAGYTTAGVVRASQTVLGPTTLVVLTLTPTLTILAVSLHARGRRTWPVVAVATVIVGATSLLALVLLEAAPGIGRAMVGSSWPGVQDVLLPIALASALRGPYFAVPVVLRATDRIGDAVRLRLSTALPGLGLPVAGAFFWGVNGAAWGMAAAAAVNSVQCLCRLAPRASRGGHVASRRPGPDASA